MKCTNHSFSTVIYKGEGGVKKSGKMSDIAYGWPLSCLLVAVAQFGEPTLLVSAALRRLTECKANHYRCRRSFTCCFSFARVAVLFVSDDQPPPLPLIRRHRASFVLSGTSRNATQPSSQNYKFVKTIVNLQFFEGDQNQTRIYYLFLLRNILI